MLKLSLLLAIAMAPLTANAETDRPGDEESAARFIAQFVGGKADDFATESIKRDDLYSTVLVSGPGQPNCTLDMARAAPYVSAEYGWLIGSLDCDGQLVMKGSN